MDRLQELLNFGLQRLKAKGPDTATIGKSGQH